MPGRIDFIRAGREAFGDKHSEEELGKVYDLLTDDSTEGEGAFMAALAGLMNDLDLQLDAEESE